ncbi:uncharacterized protein [Oscarella lobularis]|uniref:uncharacterized protein isoform X3 n=1 Tax=Oscarella lobularis TaxID=121494 RepID=UPI00331378F6
MSTREQRLIYVLAFSVVEKRLPLEAAAILEYLRRRGVKVERGASSRPVNDGEERVGDAVTMLKSLFELLSTSNDSRKEHFSVFCSALRQNNPHVWETYLLRFTDLNDGELDSMCKGIARDPFSYAEGTTPCSDVQSDVEIMGLSSRKSFFRLDDLPNDEIEVILRSIWKHFQCMESKRTDGARFGCKPKELCVQKAVGRPRKMHPLPKKKQFETDVSRAMLHSSAQSGKLDCKRLLWRILDNKKERKHLRNIAKAKRKLSHLHLDSRVVTNASQDSVEFEKRLYEFCCEEIGQYWLPLGLRLGSSLVELEAVGDEFDRYGDSYKALAVVRKHMADEDGDATFSKIRAILLEIKRSSATSAQTTKMPSNVPRTARQFYGRVSELDAIERFFWGRRTRESHLSPISHKLQFICGIGGVGKTHLAMQYANCQENAYRRGLVCINAKSYMTMEASLREYFMLEKARGEGNLDISGGATLQQLFSMFYERVKQSNRLLILLDNADELDTIADFLPPSSVACHVLITTRATGQNEVFQRKNSTALVLETLDESAAVSALIGLSGKSKEDLSRTELDAVRKIAIEAPVEGLPIAISHAASYVQRHDRVTFTVYWEKLVEEKRQLEAASLNLRTFLRYFRLSHLENVLRRARVTTPTSLLRLKIEHLEVSLFDRQSLTNAIETLNTRRHAFLTWEMDISDIEENYPSAYSVLSCCSVMLPKSIPQEVISAALSKIHPNSTPLRLVESLSALKKYTLLKRDEFNDGSEVYNLHHLVHRSIFERLRANKEALEHVLVTVGDVMVSLMSSCQLRYIGERSRIHPHYFSVVKSMICLRMLPSDTRHICIALDITFINGEYGIVKELSSMLIANVNEMSNVSGKEKSEILRNCMCYILLSSVAAFQDDHIGGKKHFYKAFGKRSIEDFTEDELASMPNGLVVAAALYATRQDADYIFSKMAKLTRYRDVLRPTFYEMAFAFFQSGKVEMYQHLKGVFVSFSTSHSEPAVELTGLLCLAFCMLHESKYQEALDYFKQLLEFYKAFGSVLSPLEEMAVRVAAFDCCERTRQYEFGHEVLKKGLDEVKASLSADNFFSINYHTRYGYSLYLLGKFTEAVSQMRLCLAVCPQSREPFLVRNVTYICMSLMKLGKRDEIVQTLHEFEHVLQNFAVDCDNDAFLMSAKDCFYLSKVYAAMEKWNEAVALLKNRLSMYENFGTPPSSTALSMSALLALCLQKMGLIEEAYNLTNSALLHYNPRLFSDDSTLSLLEYSHGLPKS